MELFAGPAQRKQDRTDLSADGAFPHAPAVIPSAGLRQALLNLISNALKFTAKGEINVRVLRVTETNTTVTLRFEVKIPVSAFQPRRISAFSKPFPQADGTNHQTFPVARDSASRSSKNSWPSCRGRSAWRAKGPGFPFWFTAVFERQPAAAPGQEQAPEPLSRTHPGCDDTPANREILDEHLPHLGRA